MNIQLACVECIINQAKRVAETLHVDPTTASKLIEHTQGLSQSFDFSLTPPDVATPVYEDLAKILGTDDIYKELKQISTENAYSFLPYLSELIQNAEDRFMIATKIAVAGNVIDLASEIAFDLQEELEKIFHTDFAIDDTKRLQELLENAKQVVVLGDNVGEHLFDKLYIETLQQLYPDIEFVYFVRGAPIINDVTLTEAIQIGFEKVCRVVDSGVPTPGFLYKYATDEAKELFDTADLVISKGMGNYECLTPSHKSPIAFLLKVKCNVVANSLQQDVGDIICMIS